MTTAERMIDAIRRANLACPDCGEVIGTPQSGCDNPQGCGLSDELYEIANGKCPGNCSGPYYGAGVTCPRCNDCE